MPQNDKAVPRAYTLKLAPENPSPPDWRKPLWETHKAVNRGAKKFGDWLLTLRGGIDHKLADDTAGEDAAAEKSWRRRILALSWLSVESENGAPKPFIVASGTETPEKRTDKLVAALKEILKNRNLPEDEIEGWINDCKDSLSAAIREDAVWVNRSRAFDEARAIVGESLTRDEIWDVLGTFLGNHKKYFSCDIRKDQDEEVEADGESVQQQRGEKNLAQKARGWLSKRYGSGKGADFERFEKVYETIHHVITDLSQRSNESYDVREFFRCVAEALGLSSWSTADAIIQMLSGPGYKSKTKNLLKKLRGDLSELELLKKAVKEDIEKCKQNKTRKGTRPYAQAILKDVESACGLRYRLLINEKCRDSINEYSVMLDHAARRVSLAHTWIKRAEAIRDQNKKDSVKLQEVPETARRWLDSYIHQRSLELGEDECYIIRRRAISGWERIVEEWSTPGCKTCDDRVGTVRALQQDPTIDKFGDIQLFEALASDEALCVWHKDGDPAGLPDPAILLNYVDAKNAEFNQQRLKVPAYSHPDELLHPVFCDFGKSRWTITLESPTKGSKPITLKLWDGCSLKDVKLRWRSKRFERDIFLLGSKSQAGGSEAKQVPRADRLGLAAANASSRSQIVVKLDNPNDNGRLQVPRRQLEALAGVRDNLSLSHLEREEKFERLLNRLTWFVSVSAELYPAGPWLDFSNSRTWSEENKERGDLSKLRLCRIPHLRVLSVDLGHRCAAACAVWETVSSQDVEEICRQNDYPPPRANDLYLHIKVNQPSGPPRTVVYRRVGADVLPDGTPHPAPWARLDRQFLIKLQGEDEEARAASAKELWLVHQMETKLGRAPALIDRLIQKGWGKTDQQKKCLEQLKTLEWQPATNGFVDSYKEELGTTEPASCSRSVTELMASAVRVLRLALNRHANRARLASYLVATEKTLPGDRKVMLKGEEHVEHIIDALVLWVRRFRAKGWLDSNAANKWESPLRETGFFNLDALQTPAVSKENLKKLREELKPLAKFLVKNFQLRQELHEFWRQQWESEDEVLRTYIRQIRRWLFPRTASVACGAVRKVGGLSLWRLSVITEFRRKVQVSFFTRLRPDGTRQKLPENFGQKTLDALEQLREQRVKQLASRVVEAALGIGSENPRHWNGKKRPRERI